MELDLYHIDAFANQVFRGNPACVMPLEEWPTDGLLLSIAQENAVAETAYLVRQGAGQYHLRWFTPDVEMDLCGHATLAAAHVVLTELEPDLDEVHFVSASGPLVVTRSSQGYEMTLPNRKPEPAILPAEIEESLSLPPTEVHKARDFLLVYKSQRDVEEFSVNRHLFDRVNLGTGGVIVTAPGDGVDFVSRFFTPQATILEDPVTGSAHCTSAPYWAEKLGKTVLHARQISARGGELWCQVLPAHVLISGQVVTYAKSRVFLP